MLTRDVPCYLYPEPYRIHRTLHVSMLCLAYDNGLGNRRPPILMISRDSQSFLAAVLSLGLTKRGRKTSQP